MLLWAVLGVVCSMCKLKEVNDRGNSDVELFVWWVGTAVCQTPLIHSLVWHCKKRESFRGLILVALCGCWKPIVNVILTLASSNRYPLQLLFRQFSFYC